jgi:hypothetical protein
MSTFDEILGAALVLPAEARAMLADQLLETLVARTKTESMRSGQRKPSDECARSTKEELLLYQEIK